MSDPTIFHILMMVNSKRAEYAGEPIKLLIENKLYKIIKYNMSVTPNVNLESISVEGIANLAYIVENCENKFLRKIARRRIGFIKKKYGEQFK